MWTKGYMNDDNIQMLIFLLIFLFSINITNGFNENTTNIILYNHTLPIEKLLHQQYDNRQIKLNHTTNNNRPWKKSNSIETLKKIMATYRQRTSINNRALTITNITTMTTTQYTTTTATTPTTTATDLPITSAFLVRVKSKIQSTQSSIIDETSSNIEYIPQTTDLIVRLYSSTTLKMNTSSSNATIFVIILVCSFSGFIFLAFVFTFLLRRRINIAYFKLPCIHSSSEAKDSRDNTPLSHSPIHGKHK
ncbi:unnamed protein product [Rotaria sordida]|uniref:Uncharacterized protein n=1 Tax=Rotaria sordida TaxID=392033 RepID=A0A814Q3Q7_9BILA|nr:unnamed protein product [Rotaria sordida]CAF1114954.1 unnamed protein product [Rotaria sordida]CAF3525102.1 unnamed protein product [Rotaria sordida]CAF3576494.1 unnamed protein product [Rotaria sordida]